MKSRKNCFKLLVLIFFALSLLMIELSSAAESTRSKISDQNQSTSHKTKKLRGKTQKENSETSKEEKEKTKEDKEKTKEENKAKPEGANTVNPRIPSGRGNSSRERVSKKHKDFPLIEDQLKSSKATDPIIIDNEKTYVSGDGVCMSGIYFKGNANQDTVPVILLHDFEGSGQDLFDMGTKFAKEGMAVLIPDLRGHGECYRRTINDYSHGPRPVKRIDENYTYDGFNKDDYHAMINYDGLFWYQLLYQFHNKELLNLRKLVVIGVGFGSAVGLGWVKNDWSFPSTKTGRFAKVLVFISPKLDQCKDFIDTMKRKRTGETLTYLGIVGKLDNDLNKDMQKFQIDLGGKQAKLDDNASSEEKKEWLEKKRFPVYYFNTKTNGLSILTSDTLNATGKIIEYINFRLQTPKMVKNFKWSKIEFEEK